MSCLIAKWDHGGILKSKIHCAMLGRGRKPMSHKDKGRYGPIRETDRVQNTNGNCVPRDCKERVDGRNKRQCTTKALASCKARI